MPSTFIIAEIGVNHNGSLELAHKLVDEAYKAGANAVKFQSFNSASLVVQKLEKAEYQKKNTQDSSRSQLEMLKSLELSEDEQISLIEYGEKLGVELLATPFDHESLRFLVKNIKSQFLKIGSGDLTNAPLLYESAKSQKKIILSTGMANLTEIEQALAVLSFGYINNSKESPSIDNFYKAYYSKQAQKILKDKVALLHCTSQYPTPPKEVNLNAMKTLESSFGLNVGYSDHTSGIHVSVAAVALGAQIVEKHFTLDKNLEGPDHKASLEPDEFQQLVSSIRDVESSLGSMRKVPSPVEFENIPIARKGIVTAKKIAMGEPFTHENLTVKRCGEGMPPIKFWDYLNKKAQKDYDVDELI